MTEIAFTCGFRSVRNFNRAYRAIEGAEPRALLK
jgi:transcriptional regulator GlxA family with amidase domain